MQPEPSNPPSILLYLNFAGHCDEALAYYQKALDAKVEMLMRFSESPEPIPAGMLQPGFENKVMHSCFVVGGSRIMASDGCHDKDGFSGFTVSYWARDEAEARRYFAALAEDGKVKMPLAETFWSPLYGMLEDRFGLSWMISLPPKMG